MEKEHQPINNFDFDLNLIANFFKGLDRQGPGSVAQTLKALHEIEPHLPEVPQIADLGCGTGGQTVTLAKALPHAHITAVDLLPQMIEGVQARIAQNHLSAQITPVQASMDALPLADASLDLIWAEGSIYHIGFECGLRAWRRWLKSGGFVAVTECCWLSDRRPADLQWFTDNFTEIDTLAQKIAILQRAGYEPTAHFILPSSCWTEAYYRPMEARIRQFEAENPACPSMGQWLDQLKTEIDVYRRWGELYGYVFFVGRKL
ncbi:MAG: class I SAM-dependent methyltransferase [Alistipes sp.]|nr:class I SAM-dependent methyltransferase [Alistipes sp.]